MTQTDRIRRMEALLNQLSDLLRRTDCTRAQLESLLPAIKELTAYYESPLWRQDFEDDCAGKLPKDLKRGVLSEDAVYNLLSDIQALHEQIKHLSSK